MNTVKINKLDNKGRGITYYKDKIMFVKGALEKETVEIDHIREYKKYYVSETKRILNRNESRSNAKCPYYGSCGGCNLMHMGIEYQEEYKTKKIKEILGKYAGISNEIKFVKNNKELYYRNKITLKIENGLMGYYNEETHDIINVNNCLLVNNEINRFIKSNIIKIDNGEIVIRCNYDDELLISIKSKEQLKYDLDDSFKIVGIVFNDDVVYGKSYFYDYIGEFKFKISYNSFFQVNNYMASNIFMILKSNLKGNSLLDLYCGVGTLGISLKDNFNKIYGIEKIENAIIDAKENSLLNNCNNTRFYVGDTYEVLKNIEDKFDTIIVDPPRSGLNDYTLDLLLKLKPSNICYVSCDPFTLARDLNVLKHEYDIEKVNALDMFPNTYHVECVCILKCK